MSSSIQSSKSTPTCERCGGILSRPFKEQPKPICVNSGCNTRTRNRQENPFPEGFIGNYPNPNDAISSIMQASIVNSNN